jgi:hypothetical protein
MQAASVCKFGALSSHWFSESATPELVSGEIDTYWVQYVASTIQDLPSCHPELAEGSLSVQRA